MEQIKIEKITIKLNKQVFSYYYSDKQDKVNEILKEKETFINSVPFAFENKEDLGYKIEFEVYYYVGKITFLPTKTDSANLTLDLNIDKKLIHLIISHSLKNVVEVCDKQTEMFKSMYFNYNIKLLDWSDFIKNLI